MYRTMVCSFCLVLLSAATVLAEESGVNGPDPAAAAAEAVARTVRGMAVLGNDEAPMSLFIVPWKSSELGAATNLSRTLNERDLPVDRDVFMRELDFYQVSVAGKTAASTAGSKILN